MKLSSLSMILGAALFFAACVPTIVRLETTPSGGGCCGAALLQRRFPMESRRVLHTRMRGKLC